MLCRGAICILPAEFWHNSIAKQNSWEFLGHEMGHVTARHTAQQQTNQQLGQLVLAGGMMASKEIYELADVAMAGMQLLFLSFSRDHERESDRLGVEYATKMGYDAHKMADFFAVLDKNEYGK